MTRPGPKPTPTETLKARGSWRAKLRNKTEPKPSRSAPKCPSWLDDAAKKKWKELAPKLNRVGLLTSLDGDALANYCIAWSQLMKADEVIQVEGMTFKTTTGYISPHPMVAIRRAAMDDLRRFGALFGLNPADRTRVHGGKDTNEEESGRDKAKLSAKFFGGGRAG